MNNSINILSKRILPASLSSLAVLLLASCADETTPASADKLPAEVRFTAALGAPLTRATTSGVWETGELVAVEIGSERKQYVVRTADGTMSGNGEANTYYWMTPSDPPKVPERSAFQPTRRQAPQPPISSMRHCRQSALGATPH